MINSNEIEALTKILLYREEVQKKIYGHMDVIYKDRHDGVGFFDKIEQWMSCSTCAFYSPTGRIRNCTEEESSEFLGLEESEEDHICNGPFCRYTGDEGVGELWQPMYDIGIENGCWRPADWVPIEILDRIETWLDVEVMPYFRNLPLTYANYLDIICSELKQSYDLKLLALNLIRETGDFPKTERANVVAAAAFYLANYEYGSRRQSVPIAAISRSVDTTPKAVKECRLRMEEILDGLNIHRDHPKIGQYMEYRREWQEREKATKQTKEG